MKLLDLQTLKYPELEKNWGYFGNKILIISNEDEELSIQEWLDAIEYDEIEKHDYDMLDIEPHTNPIINKLAEEIGAVIYGGRYVLVFEDNNGDIFCEKTNFGTVYYISKNQYRFLPVKDFNEKNDITATVDRFFMLNKAPQHKIGNIFEEFAKKEQGLENKFDELYYLIYGKK